MTGTFEERVTDWMPCSDGPWYTSMSHGGYVAYRVWQRFDGVVWLQRHEWKTAKGGLEDDGWMHGVNAWLTSHAEKDFFPRPRK